MTKLHFLWIFLVCLLTLFLVPAWSTTGVVIGDFTNGADQKGVPVGWQLKEKSGRANLSVVEENGVSALRLTSNDSSFSIQKTVDVDVSRYPVMSWRWKVTRLPEGGDFRKSKTDDQAAQLFLAFSRTKAIVYIWDTTAPQGLSENAPSPPFMNIKAVVVQSGGSQTGRWLTETRNVYKDYKKLFGHEPPPVGGIRIQINSQHTSSAAESYFADVVFRSQ
ncbi:MAG: DUF3047 domain-containing protein [Desulfobacterales bacterium]|jgi:hypothetical protein